MFANTRDSFAKTISNPLDTLRNEINQEIDKHSNDDLTEMV